MHTHFKVSIGILSILSTIVSVYAYMQLLPQQPSSYTIAGLFRQSSTPTPTPTLTPPQISTITPTSTPVPTATPLSTPTPVPVTHFSTLPPGSILPSGSECAQRIRRTGWEPRPENKGPNSTVGHGYAIIDWGPNSFGQNERANTLRARIDGNFTGTTDEILQWAACKWGIDEDIARGQAVKESFWRMSQQGDTTDNGEECAKFGQSAPCVQSYGILQVKVSVHRNTWPAAHDSTAFNADYTYGYWRSCFEGYVDWLKSQKPDYHAGDAWGCLGFWYSGSWYTDGVQDYISKIQENINSKRWLQSDF